MAYPCLSVNTDTFPQSLQHYHQNQHKGKRYPKNKETAATDPAAGRILPAGVIGSFRKTAINQKKIFEIIITTVFVRIARLHDFPPEILPAMIPSRLA
jgi:hypothetical protein